MERFIKSQEVKGYQDIVEEQNELLDYLALGKVTLAAGETYAADTSTFEVALVILSGIVSVSAEDQKWTGLGGRANVFDGKATTVYVPCQSSYNLLAESDVQVAVCKVKAEEKYAPFVVRPDEIVVNERGEQSWNRTVHDILVDAAEGRVHRIVLGETFNEPGQWSGFPPHKHDGEFAPEEPFLEEVYHFQVNPEQGFGVQLHYTKDKGIDEAHIIRQGDSFAIDKGYHPVVAAGGYQVYYLWFMAGNTGRKLRPYEDPDHKWVKSFPVVTR